MLKEYIESTQRTIVMIVSKANMSEISNIKYFAAGNYTEFYSFTSWYISPAGT